MGRTRPAAGGFFTGGIFSEKLFHAPFVQVSHGTQADPILN